MNGLVELHKATEWLWSESLLLARHGALVLVRLGTKRAFAAIDARLRQSINLQVIAAVCGATTGMGSEYRPSAEVVRRLWSIWLTVHPAGGIYRVLERGAEHVPLEGLHAVLGNAKRGEDVLRLLVLSGSWTALSPALRHLTRVPLDLSAFDLTEFAAIEHPLVGSALLSLLSSSKWSEGIEQQFLWAFELLPSVQARRGLERLTASGHEGIAAAARAALEASPC